MASVSELALILHNDEVTVTENKTDALIKAAALAHVNLRSHISWVAGPAPAGGPAPAAAPAEEKEVGAKKEEPEESGD
uniref:Uncharacterized protein n=1 Tax=Jaculus jaculus TaxID=51337 RepID=A0A8C5P250_JACJA